MKVVILAAGRGSRFYPYTKYIPKCLLDIGSETILEHQINHIRNCGIDKVVIVVGFGFEKVENFLRLDLIQARLAENPMGKGFSVL
jgi:NDP-sugar pyrophosphorylase family protein